MNTNYRYILGIDLGIASIGTALFNISPDATDLNDPRSFDSILDAGVRICSLSAGAAERREFRSQRIHKRHRKDRKRRLIALLQEYHLLPTDNKLIELGLRSQPYHLRAAGMQKPYDSPHKLGYALLHLSRFRGAGFIDEETSDEIDDGMSNELDKTINKEITAHTLEETMSKPKKAKKETKTRSRYRIIEEEIKELDCTLSEFLARHLEENKCIRQRAEFVTNKVPFSIPRYLVKKDFYSLFEKQAPVFHINLEQIQNIYDIIFKDFPRAPYANGKCTLNFQSGEERLPRMHRLAELRRMYEQCNNLRYTTVTNISPISLQKDMRDALIEILMTGEGLNKTKIKKIISPLSSDKVLTVNLYEAEAEIPNIKGFAHIKAFAHIPHWQILSENEQDLIIEFIADPINPDTQNKLYDEETFVSICKEHLHLTDSTADQKIYACINALPKNRTKVGKTATVEILKKLIEGSINDDGTWQALTFIEAAQLCKFNDAAEEYQKMQGTFGTLPYYGEALRFDTLPIHPWHIERACKEEQIYGRIPNPVVHVMLNQLRKVVNEIVELYGKPEMIKIELARDFGLSTKKREELETERIKNIKDNNKINAELQEYGYAPNSKNRRKYKLWKQQGERDIYTLENIPFSDIGACEIDHIIPTSAGGSNTMANFALTSHTHNFAKGEMFAYEFIEKEHPEKWEAVKREVLKLSKGKSWRFMPNAREKFQAYGDEDNADHRLQDTRYMSKLAYRYLSLLCPNVLAIKGAMTAQLRHVWGLDGLEYELMGLNVSREHIIKETGEVLVDVEGNIAKNPDWEPKPRIDHRHHAMDAIVLCGVTRSQAQKIYHADKQGKRVNFEVVPAPFADSKKHRGQNFRNIVLDALGKIKISHKSEHGFTGALHNQTAIRILGYDEKKDLYATVYQRAFSNLKSIASLEKIAVSEKLGNSPQMVKLREKCENIIYSVKNKMQEAENYHLQRNNENLENGLKEIKITEQSLLQKAIELAHIGVKYPAIDNISLVNIREELQCGYKPDSNHCVVFYEITEGKNTGKVAWECQKTFDAAQENKKTSSEKASWEKEGKLIWKIHKGDMLELKITTEMVDKYEIPRNFLVQIAENEYIFLVKVLKLGSGYLVFVPTIDARPQQENPNKVDKESFKFWKSGGLGLKFYTECQARKIEISPFGKVRRKHRKLWSGKKTKSIT